VVGNLLKSLLIFTLILINQACAFATQVHTPETTVEVTASATAAKTITSCRPTLDDGVSPSYKSNTPEQTLVGHGHVISGVVLSSLDCKPIAHAKLEFWPEYEGQGHPDSARATFYTDENGAYRFECDPPEHIHMRISAEGYQTIGVNSYHPEGAAEGTFDIVLKPQ
jgi:protocatechuate 3,4-dioxygenase beta subunit